MTLVLLALTGICAAGDWVAVQRQLLRLEYLLKPLTLALLVVTAATADLPAVKWWIVAALVFGLLGDVGLMLSDAQADKPDLPFLLGLGSFLGGHVCYLAGFARFGVQGDALVAGALVVLGAAVLALPAVVRGAVRTGGRDLAVVVCVYAVALCAMTVLAVGTDRIATAIGGVLFLTSDMLIAVERFVRRIRFGPLLVIVTYHVAQVLIVVGLVASF